MGKFQESIDYFQKSLEAVSSLSEKSESQTGSTLFKIARVYSNMGKYDKALENYFKLLDVRVNVSDRQTADVYSGIGQIFIYQGKFKEAHEFFNKSLVIYRSLFQDEVVMLIQNFIVTSTPG